MSSSSSSYRTALSEFSYDEPSEKVGDLLISSTLPADLSDSSTSSGHSQSPVSSGAEDTSDYYDLLLNLDDVMHAAFHVPGDWRTTYSHFINVVRQDSQFQECLAAFGRLKEPVDEDKKIELLQEMDSRVRRVVAHNAPDSQARVSDPLFQAGASIDLLKVYDLRSHHATVLLHENNLRLIYHDHSAMLLSPWFSLADTDDVDIFIAMLIGYNSLSDTERRPNGFVTILDPEQQEEFLRNVQSRTAPQRDVFSGLSIRLEREGRTIIVDVQHVIFRDGQLEGRSTCVLAATSEEWPGKQLAVKLSWQGTSRRRDEDEYIRAARDKAEEIGDQWVLDHLPEIFHTQDIVHEGDATEQRLRHFFRECDVPKGFVYHPRHLRVIVSELLLPITSLSSETEVAQVFVHAMQCHKWLFDNPRILHRDINTDNIMYRINCQGVVCGVLNDFDMSCYREDIVNGLPPVYLRSTGTLPYMALDRADLNTLHIASHFYCHDLESFFYVMFLFASRYVLLGAPVKRASGPPQRYGVFPGAPFDEWYKGDEHYLELLNQKRQLLKGDFPVKSSVSSSFRNFAPWLVRLQGLIRMGMQAREAREKEREDMLFCQRFWEEEYVENEHAELLDDDDLPSLDMVEERLEALDKVVFDEETLGGYVSCGNFMPLTEEADGLKML